MPYCQIGLDNGGGHLGHHTIPVRAEHPYPRLAFKGAA
jgi:hypothetical protein